MSNALFLSFMKQLQNSARMFLGVVFGLIGLIGLVMPLIPGVPFLLLAAACLNGLDNEEMTTPSRDPDRPANTQD